MQEMSHPRQILVSEVAQPAAVRVSKWPPGGTCLPIGASREAPPTAALHAATEAEAADGVPSRIVNKGVKIARPSPTNRNLVQK